ncbi:Outer membrane protein OmpA [Tranquillimonas rosea]|uniref:Outer membrane protein OmpA n=1 Tax=Tranquillimonas rosea TaxID=641238 RepID=A0A1H9UW93_9RHOB|nr:OmpA family protein [Tranquillimonas rosea]SES13696.1 Outer membrane protein OmpA [Tranquillimonas rosea]
MRRTLAPLLLSAAGLALAACEAPPSADWYQEAGADIDEGGFGNPTMQNTRLMTGEATVLQSLNTRFSREVDPMVNFAFNSASLSAEAQRTLARQATWIRQFPEVRFRVYGHTDLVGSQAYNKQLGLRRAQTVVSFLTSHGISRSRLEAVASFGETQPLIVTQQPEMRNRRTVTEVTGLVGGHPMVLNGKYAQVIFREYVASATEVPSTGGAGDGGGGPGAGGGGGEG